MKKRVPTQKNDGLICHFIYLKKVGFCIEKIKKKTIY